VQVSCAFDAGTESAGPASRRDSNHDHFVSWDTRFGAEASRNRRHDWINHCLEPSPACSPRAVGWPRNPTGGSRSVENCCVRGHFGEIRTPAVEASLGPAWSASHSCSRKLLVLLVFWSTVCVLGEVCRPTSAGDPPVKLPGRDRHARTS